MTRTDARPKRMRGSIETLPSGALRVKVYAGPDPVTGGRHYLMETIPPGREAPREAERARTRLLNQVDERRNPRTRSTVDQLLDRWLEVADLEVSTRRNYIVKIDKHIRPVLGSLSVAKVDTETLETFYAGLRKCRDRCRGRRFVQHRTFRDHACDPRCAPHVCRGLADSTVRQIHWILSGALARAVKWHWIAINPADNADKPPLPHPDPRPPSATEAAQILNEAWKDADWGAFLWLAMTSGARRAELCALRWTNVDLDTAILTLRRSLYVDDDGTLVEKDTKTHQQRRVALDTETIAVLQEHRARHLERAEAIGVVLPPDGYLFSPQPDGRTPLIPDTATQRYGRLAARLDLDTDLHQLRHYSATELITGGVDVRTVAGRLGHGGGGATTLRVYAAWNTEADQRAATTMAGRMPARPRAAGADE